MGLIGLISNELDGTNCRRKSQSLQSAVYVTLVTSLSEADLLRARVVQPSGAGKAWLWKGERAACALSKWRMRSEITRRKECILIEMLK